jgi:hypothetical protein
MRHERRLDVVAAWRRSRFQYTETMIIFECSKVINIRVDNCTRKTGQLAEPFPV